MKNEQTHKTQTHVHIYIYVNSASDMPCFEHKVRGTYRHCPAAAVTPRQDGRKWSSPHVGTEYRPACHQLHKICIQKESSLNPSSKTLEPDRQQYDTRYLRYRPTVFCWQLLLIQLSYRTKNSDAPFRNSISVGKIAKRDH